MNREIALGALRSSSSRERLRAAQYFVENGAGEDAELLSNLRASETDMYVRRRLELALNRERRTRPQDGGREPPVADLDSRLPATEFARAVEWVGGVFIHELEGPIGRVAYRASREIPEYEDSKSRQEIDYLKDVFSGISQLVIASRSPKPEEFDLAELLDEIADAEVPPKTNVTRQGPRPFLVTVDRALLRLALLNGVKNAAEAVEQISSGGDSHAITVTWGETDRDQWISIIDQGPGLPSSPGSIFGIGTSTKTGHTGFGLAIAMRAMESLGGTVTLQSGTDGGAQYELRWNSSP